MANKLYLAQKKHYQKNKEKISAKHKLYWKEYKIKNKDKIKERWRKQNLKRKRNRRSYKGFNNPNWKGGLSKINHAFRTIPRYYQWRSDVFRRDNWKCRTCGKGGDILEAHHIKEVNNILKDNSIKTIYEALNCPELWNLDNGITLCKDCHNLTKPGRPKKNKLRLELGKGFVPN